MQGGAYGRARWTDEGNVMFQAVGPPCSPNALDKEPLPTHSFSWLPCVRSSMCRVREVSSWEDAQLDVQESGLRDRKQPG